MRQRFRQMPEAPYDLLPIEEWYERYGNRGQSGPMVIPDLQPYVSPVTLKLVDGRKQQREDLARNNCRVAEPSERPTFSRPPPERDINWKF